MHLPSCLPARNILRSAHVRNPDVVANTRVLQNTLSRQRPSVSRSRERLTVQVESNGRSLTERLTNPAEAFSLGPRVMLGTTLSILEDMREPKGANVTNPFDEVSIFLQDPRSPTEKAEQLYEDLESRVLDAADRGTELEAGVVELLEAGLTDMGVDTQDLRRQLEEVLPFPLPSYPGADGAATGGGGGGAVRTPGMASKGSLADRIADARERQGGGSGEEGVVAPPPPPPLTPEQMAALRTAAEVDRIRGSVSALRNEVECYTDLIQQGETKKMKLASWDLRDKRDSLERILRESSLSVTSSATGSTSSELQDIMAQAQQLVDDVKSLPI